jgi:hypothetical protein
MAITDPTSDVIPNDAAAGFTTDWDWKGNYVSTLENDGYERFSQYSATPDTTLLYAGPARFSGLNGDASVMVPIGLTDGLSIQQDAGLQRLYEIGSNRAFFTRGKTQSAISLGRMLADQSNILYALSNVAYRPLQDASGYNAPGGTAPNANIMMNLDSEYFAVPFGLLVIFKTRGGGDGFGEILSASYLESCMFQNYAFQVASQSPVIVENVSLQFDRAVPVSFNS